ncbi:unnamed protein product, partial [Brenthis ino]
MEDKPCYPCEQEVIEKNPPCPLQCMSPKCKAYQRTAPIDSNKTPIVWVLGGPGSGADIQCQMITAKYGFIPLSTGDLLRAEAKSGSDRAKCLATIMERRELVPNDVVVDLLNKTMLAMAGEAKGFLINNFPREKAQGIFFEKKITPVTVIIYLEVSPENLAKLIPTDAKSTIDPQLKTFLENNEQILEHWPNKIKRISAEGTADAIFSQVSQFINPLIA